MKTSYIVGIIVVAAIVVAGAAYMLWPRPAIDVTYIASTTNFARTNEPFNVTVLVKNNGGAAATYTLDLKADNVVKNSTTFSIDPGETKNYTYTLSFNTTGTKTISAGSQSKIIKIINPIFSDVRARQALAYAFDANTYIQEILMGGGQQPNSCIPEGLFGYNPNIPRYTYNLTKARELLTAVAADYGFSPSNPLQLTLYYNTGNSIREKFCLLLSSAINSLNTGLTINVQSVAWPQFLYLRDNGLLPIFNLGWLPDYVDPDDYLVPFYHSQKGTFPSRTGWSNPTVNALIDQQAQISNETERQLIIDQINTLVYQDCPYIWLSQPQGIHFEKTWIQGWIYNPAYSGFYYAKISKTSAAPNQDVIMVESIGEPQYVDPAIDYESAGGEVIEQVYERLFWFPLPAEGQWLSDASTVVPWLAESYTLSQDGLIYTITLRQGINFHDGTPFNATAVKYSLDRVIIMSDPNGPGWCLDPMKGAAALREKVWDGTATQADVDAYVNGGAVRIIDDYTVQIELDYPYSPFLKVLAYSVAAIVSPTYVEAHGGVQIGQQNEWMNIHAEAGTGPYILESWTPGIVTLVKNNNYWGGPNHDITPIVERVIIKDVPDGNTRLTDLKSGATDFAVIDRANWFTLINETAWRSSKTVTSLDPTVRAIGPIATLQIDFLGISTRF